jgi:hypothetical protein
MNRKGIGLRMTSLQTFACVFKQTNDREMNVQKTRSPGRSPEGKGGFPGRLTGRVIMTRTRQQNKK